MSFPAHHLVFHGLALGMSGSGKTGLLTVLMEEALMARVPTLVVDVKGDLTNLLLAVPSFSPEALAPWAEGMLSPSDPRAKEQFVAALARTRAEALRSWGLGAEKLEQFRRGVALRVITPGSSAGEPLHLPSSLQRCSSAWAKDPEAARSALSAKLSLALHLLRREPDPLISKEHLLLSLLAERRIFAGESITLAALLEDLKAPPFEQIGAVPIEEFLSQGERRELASALNSLLASPTFASWRTGTLLDPESWLSPREDGRTPAVIVNVAHLDESERNWVLAALFEEVLTWTRSLPGGRRLRALCVVDEVHSLLPSHPPNPPTKRPLAALLRQGRTFGVGTLLATPDLMDLDCPSLSNPGTWWIGKLQTDAERSRAMDCLAASGIAKRENTALLSDSIRRLSLRWFLMGDRRVRTEPVLLRPRAAISLLRTPMTRRELQLALELEHRLSPAASP